MPLPICVFSSIYTYLFHRRLRHTRNNMCTQRHFAVRRAILAQGAADDEWKSGASSTFPSQSLDSCCPSRGPIGIKLYFTRASTQEPALLLSLTPPSVSLTSSVSVSFSTSPPPACIAASGNRNSAVSPCLDHTPKKPAKGASALRHHHTSPSSRASAGLPNQDTRDQAAGRRSVLVHAPNRQGELR